jgi:hypothetical protein
MLLSTFSAFSILFLLDFWTRQWRFVPFSLSRLLPAHKFSLPQNQLLVLKNLLFRHIFAQEKPRFHHLETY